MTLFCRNALAAVEWNEQKSKIMLLNLEKERIEVLAQKVGSSQPCHLTFHREKIKKKSQKNLTKRNNKKKSKTPERGLKFIKSNRLRRRRKGITFDRKQSSKNV